MKQYTRYFLSTLSILLLLNVGYGQNETVASGDLLITNALEQAKAANKNVFLMFKASWCGLCKKLKKTMDDPAIRDMFQENYIFEDLVVFESKRNKHLENPGAEIILERFKGTDSGIPYWLILNPSGTVLANSKLDEQNRLLGSGVNIGCPITQNEIEGFLYKLQKTSKLTSKELGVIGSKFREGS